MTASTQAHPKLGEPLYTNGFPVLTAPTAGFVPQDWQDSDLLRKIGFLPGLRELIMTRQVHALEHATVWVLSELDAGFSMGRSPIDDGTLSGLSTERGFYLYGEINGLRLRRAVHLALHRLIEGEWHLAIHPRCGTNISVNLALTASLALGMHMLMPRGFLEQMLGLGIAASAAAQMTPDMGRLVQQYVTTAIPFNLQVEGVYCLSEKGAPPEHFVKVRWIEPNS